MVAEVAGEEEKGETYVLVGLGMPPGIGARPYLKGKEQAKASSKHSACLEIASLGIVQ